MLKLKAALKGLSPCRDRLSPKNAKFFFASFLNIFICLSFDRRATPPVSPPQQRCVCVYTYVNIHR